MKQVISGRHYQITVTDEARFAESDGAVALTVEHHGVHEMTIALTMATAQALHNALAVAMEEAEAKERAAREGGR